METQLDPQLKDYRDTIVAADQKSVEMLDKNLLVLSAGGLALSLTFLKEFIGKQNINAEWSLFCAWALWILSIALTLFSFYCSHRALRRTIVQIGDNKLFNQKTGKCEAGGLWTKVTSVLTLASCIGFLVGLVLIGNFVYSNLRTVND